MKKAYLGVDIGSISTKGVIIDEENNILASTYGETNADPINATKRVLKSLEQEMPKDYKIVGVGTTGSARKLIGKMLGANIVKNEITAHATGTLSKYPNVRTILEIGGQDSKIILLKNKIVTDYAMNTLCAAGCGAFLTSQAKRLNIPITDFGKIALTSKNPTPIAARCTVFAESDLIHKAQAGYKKEDIIAGLCNSIVLNYLNNVAKGKKIVPPIVFQGGVSKNIGVKHFFEENLKEKVIVDKDSHLLGCLGIAILSKKEKEIDFSFDINNFTFKSYETTCKGCPNRCEIISIKKDNKLIDSWGNRCEKGTIKV
ncbi:MAG: acyl-CoA dehydratase activase [Bacilli bacterium]